MEPFPGSAGSNPTTAIDAHQLHIANQIVPQASPTSETSSGDAVGTSSLDKLNASSLTSGNNVSMGPPSQSYATSGASQLSGGGKREWELYNLPLPLLNINLSAPVNPLHTVADAHPHAQDGVHAPTSGTIMLDETLLKRCAMPPGRSVLCYSPNMDFTLYIPQELLHCTQGLISFLNDFNQVGPNRIKVKPAICGKYYDVLKAFMNANPKRPIITGISPSSRSGVQQSPDAVLQSFIHAVPEGFEVPELQPDFDGGGPLPLTIPPRLHSAQITTPLPQASYTYADALCRRYVNSRDDICPLGARCTHLHPFILMSPESSLSPDTNHTSGEDELTATPTAENTNQIVKKSRYTHILHPRIGYNQSHRRLPDGSAAAPYATLPPGVVFQISLPNQNTACMAVSSENIYVTNGSKIHYELVTQADPTHNQRPSYDAQSNHNPNLPLNNRGKISRHRASTIMQHCAHYTKNAVCCLGADCQFVHMANFSLPADPPTEKKPIERNMTYNTATSTTGHIRQTPAYPHGNIMVPPHGAPMAYAPIPPQVGFPMVQPNVVYPGIIPSPNPMLGMHAPPYHRALAPPQHQQHPNNTPPPFQMQRQFTQPVGGTAMPPHYMPSPQNQAYAPFGYLPPAQQQHPVPNIPASHYPQHTSPLLTIDPATGMVVPMSPAQIATYLQQTRQP